MYVMYVIRKQEKDVLAEVPRHRRVAHSLSHSLTDPLIHSHTYSHPVSVSVSHSHTVTRSRGQAYWLTNLQLVHT